MRVKRVGFGIGSLRGGTLRTGSWAFHAEGVMATIDWTTCQSLSVMSKSSMGSQGGAEGIRLKYPLPNIKTARRPAPLEAKKKMDEVHHYLRTSLRMDHFGARG